MTNKKNTYQPNNRLYVPSRKEFHKEFAGTISEADFNTCRPNPYRMDAQFGAYRFNQHLMTTACQREFIRGL